MIPLPTLRSTLLLIALMLPGPGTPAFAADPGLRTPFGLTNVWTLHLVLSASNWAAMMPGEPSRPGRFPGRPPGTAAETGNRPWTDDAPPPAGPPMGPGPLEREYPWASGTFEGDGQVLTNVALRFKGNSSFAVSRGGLKRPFKIDFDRGAKGRTWLGVEELYLNNNVNDATQFREALAYEVYRRAGLPAPRTAFARLHLTLAGERTNFFVGLYTVVEAVEGDFLETHFATKKGLLLKPERLRGLEYLGEDWNDYAPRYEPKSDVRRSDAARFIALARLVAHAEPEVFNRELPGRLDLAGFLRFVAVTAWLANYDSFLGNGHNYYLFQPTNDGKAVFVPWDLNEAFGGHPMAGPRRQQAEFSILRPQGAPNRLIERVLANPAWAAAYREEIGKLGADACAPGRLQALAAELAHTVQEAVFDESPYARTAFQQVALGETNLATTLSLESPRRPPAGFGPGPGPREEGTLRDWIQLRSRLVAEELGGRRTATTPRMQRGPGGPPR